MDQTYREALPSGGDVVVTPGRWYLRYWIADEGSVYGGTFRTIDASQVEEMARCWEMAFARYEQKQEPGADEDQTEVPGGLLIAEDGVYLCAGGPGVHSRQELEQLLTDYQKAGEIAAFAQMMLPYLFP